MSISICRLLLAMSVLIPAAQSAMACSCGGPNPICSVYFGSPVVFRGTVVEKTLERPPIQEVRNLDGSTSKIMTPGIYKVRLSVSEGFRGAEGKQELTVSTNEQSSACGFPFEVGKEYLVFTYKNEAEDQLWTSKCSKTHALQSSTDMDLEWMRGLAAAPPGGMIFGHLMLSRTEPFTRGAVTIRGAANHDVAPDATGSYEVKSLPAGEYKVSMTAAPGFTNPAERTVTVAEKGCAEVDWYVSYDGHVRGRVADVDGIPMGHLMLNLEKKDANSASGMAMVNLKETGEDGRYDFPQVAPGEYIVIANNLGASPARPFPKVYYPASSTLEGALPVQVSASGSVDGVDIVMPRAWKKVTMGSRQKTDNSVR
jgi:hypothetical protein